MGWHSGEVAGSSPAVHALISLLSLLCCGCEKPEPDRKSGAGPDGRLLYRPCIRQGCGVVVVNRLWQAVKTVLAVLLLIGAASAVPLALGALMYLAFGGEL